MPHQVVKKIKVKAVISS